MPRKAWLERFPLHKDVVEFDETSCCALRTATEKIDFQKLPVTALENLRDATVAENRRWPLKKYLIIFENTIAMGLVPRDFERELYLGVIVAELERLAQGSDEISCFHERGAHEQALRALALRLASADKAN